jgi:hypothetical protein
MVTNAHKAFRKLKFALLHCPALVPTLLLAALMDVAGFLVGGQLAQFDDCAAYRLIPFGYHIQFLLRLGSDKSYPIMQRRLNIFQAKSANIFTYKQISLEIVFFMCYAIVC